MSGKSRRAKRSNVFQRKALVLAIGGSIALAFTGGAFAQATTGTIQGTVPVAPNESIQITGGAGFNRTITVGPTGQYSITLPVGTYTVTLLQDGRPVQSRAGVTPAAAGGVTVNFTSSTGNQAVQTLSTINVTATAIPEIDVTTTNQVTTITAQQLERLPLRRSAEDIAMLAPSVTPGAPLLGSGPLNTDFLVFGGASVAENAYYMDGMNTTDQLTGQGGITLPYGAIEQQQTFTSGYGAKYGRSIGGVINQIGKSGSNEWHFGFRASWQPSSWRSDPKNLYFDNPRSTTPGQEQGDLYRFRNDNTRMETIYDAYVGGPIVPDKLFFFVSAEQDNVNSDSVQDKFTSTFYRFRQHYPKLYAKLNWNINSSNFLTLTGVQNSFKQWAGIYDYDYDALIPGDFAALDQTTKNTFRVWVANYTSYITDNLTLNAMFGKMHGRYFTEQPAFPGFDPTIPHIRGSSNQNPALVTPGITNSNKNTTMTSPGHYDRITNYRLSLDYKWRTHDFTIGIDNLNTGDFDDGTVMTGPGYAWTYNQDDPGTPIIGDDPTIPPYVGPPNSNPDGSTGYYVSKLVFSNAASVRVKQRAQYVVDNWQVTPNFLLNLGIRNDQFVNYNPIGDPYIRLTSPQWQPRIGFSWDVRGDSTFKVFGNAGRYYLALPAGVALRGAGASTFTNEYYTYTGIDANGIPTGLTPLPMNPATGGVSANNEYGNPLDARTIAATNIEAEYSDNYALGMQMKLGPEWVFGATGILERLGSNIVDDWDDMDALCAAAIAQGFQYPSVAACVPNTNGIVLINPVKDQTVMLHDADGTLRPVNITPADEMFDMPVKRKYYGLTLSLTHPFDGKWFGKIMYTFSKNYGNTEGPVLSDIGQGGSSVSITEQWDYWQLMNYSNGVQLNSQRHQLKLYGYYQLTPEWRFGGNLFIGSGHPAYCLGAFGPDEQDPLGYGEAYHWCGGQPAPPGSTGFTPWVKELSLNVNYSPAWFDHKLNVGLAVLNVLNEQTPTQFEPGYGTTDTPDEFYHMVDAWTPPRTFRLTVSYDW